MWRSVFTAGVGIYCAGNLHRSTTPTRAQYMCSIIRPACVYVKGLAMRVYYVYNNSVRVDKHKSFELLL